MARNGLMGTDLTAAGVGLKTEGHQEQGHPDLQGAIAGMTAECLTINTISGRYRLHLDEQDGSRMATGSHTRTTRMRPRHLPLATGILCHPFRLRLPTESGPMCPISLARLRRIGHRLATESIRTFQVTQTGGTPVPETIVGHGNETTFLAEMAAIRETVGPHQGTIENGERSGTSETGTDLQRTGATTLETGGARGVAVPMTEIGIIGSGCASGIGMCIGGNQRIRADATRSRACAVGLGGVH